MDSIIVLIHEVIGVNGVVSNTTYKFSDEAEMFAWIEGGEGVESWDRFTIYREG